MNLHFSFAMIQKWVFSNRILTLTRPSKWNVIEPQRIWYDHTRIIEVHKIHWLDKNIRKFVVLHLGVTKIVISYTWSKKFNDYIIFIKNLTNLRRGKNFVD